MLVEKEVIGPGTYWYTDEKTGVPRRLDVTPDMTRYWGDQGSQMLSSGLTVPVPCEHDFTAHPMTPKDKLLNNAGWVNEYRVKDASDGRKDVLFAVVDVQDEEVAKKLPRTIRWTSPWINSFTDGNGKQWNNVISHLALTTRPRIVKQTPFASIAAAMSLAAPCKVDVAAAPLDDTGFCLSGAGRLVRSKRTKQLRPLYPIAFSMFSGAALADDMPPLKKKPAGKPGESGGGGNDFGFDEFEDDNEEFTPDKGGDSQSSSAPPKGPPKDGGKESSDQPPEAKGSPLGEKHGDVTMEELLCDLLSALGIHCDSTSDETAFKRSLYMAAMKKIHELTSKAQNPGPQPGEIGKQMQPQGKPASGAPNSMVQQEQQPMYMSLEDINKLSEPMKGVALAMYAENQKLHTMLQANEKMTNNLRDSKLKEANAIRQQRIALLGKLSPRAKGDLEAMVASPGMALSMGDGGEIMDPMAQTLAVLEKGLADIPRILTIEQSALSVQPQPTDGDMSAEQTDELADTMSRMMGYPPDRKAV
jgi:hypothetical protein